MLKSFKFWAIARTAEEAAACAIAPGSRYRAQGQAEVHLESCKSAGAGWRVFPVTLSVEVGQPAKKGER